jgi:hypothetical protein
MFDRPGETRSRCCTPFQPKEICQHCLGFWHPRFLGAKQAWKFPLHDLPLCPKVILKNPDFRPLWWLCSAIRHYLYFAAKDQSRLPTSVTAGRCEVFGHYFPRRPLSTNFPSKSIVHSLYRCSVLLSWTPERSPFLRDYPCQEHMALSGQNGFPKKGTKLSLTEVTYSPYAFFDISKISVWFFFDSVFSAFITSFPWQAMQTLLQLKHNSSVFTWLVNTSLLLCSN